MRFCKKCNIPVEYNQPSCPQCGGYDFYELLEPSISTGEYNRRRKKKMIIGLLICLGALIALMSIAAVGVLFLDTHSAYCIGNKETTSVKSEYILSDRQKSILLKEGLPTDYNSLTLTQKASLEAIEDMFTYLDMMYPKEQFEFSGYVAQSPLESEQLIVLSQYGKVTVCRDSENDIISYRDNFKEAKEAYDCATALNDYLAKTFTETDYIVDVDVSRMVGATDNTPSTLSNCIAAVTIFVNDSVGESTFQKIVSTVSTYLDNTAINSNVSADFYLVKDSEFTLDLPERYKTEINMEIFVNHTSYNVRGFVI